MKSSLRHIVVFIGVAVAFAGCKSKKPYEQDSALLASRLLGVGAANQALAVVTDDLDGAVLKYAHVQVERCHGAAYLVNKEAPAKPITDACDEAKSQCGDKAKCRAALAEIDKAVQLVSADAMKLGMTKDAFPTAAVALEKPETTALLDGIKALGAPHTAPAKVDAAWKDPNASAAALDAACAALHPEQALVDKRPIPEGLDKMLVGSELDLPYLEGSSKCASKGILETSEMMLQNAKRLSPAQASQTTKEVCDGLHDISPALVPVSYAARFAALQKSCQ